MAFLEKIKFTKSIFWKCAQFLSAQSINNFGIKWIFLYRVQRSISNVWLIDYKASLSRKPKPLIDENVTMIQLHHKNCTAHLLELNQNQFTKMKYCGLRLKFGYSEKATKFEKIFHLKFDVIEYVASNFKSNFFSNFEAFSEYPNFKINYLNKLG